MRDAALSYWGATAGPGARWAVLNLERAELPPQRSQ